jgi:hypothetical protein
VMVGHLFTALLAACPEPEAVLQHIDALGVPSSGWSLHLTPSDAGVLLEASAGSQSFRRELPLASCEELEAAAAVIVVSWSATLRPSEPAPRRVVQPVLVLQAPSLIPSPSVTIGAGPLVVLGSGAAVFGVDAFATVRPVGWPLALSFAATPVLQRRVPLLAGSVGWSRVSIGAGIEVLAVDRAVRLSVWVRVLGGPLWLDASGVPGARALVSLDLGSRLGARLEVTTFGAWRPYVELSATSWVIRHTARVAGEEQAVALPVVEGGLALGLAWAP